MLPHAAAQQSEGMNWRDRIANMANQIKFVQTGC